MIRELALRQLEEMTDRIQNIRTLNYNDRSVGLRTPDSPVGVLLNDTGIAQLYAGSSKFLLGINGKIKAIGDRINIETKEISLNPNSIGDIRILGKSIDPDVFWSRDYVMINKKSLENVTVITPETIVDLNTGKILNSKPLLDYLEPKELFVNSEQPVDLNLERTLELAETLGMSIPEWI